MTDRAPSVTSALDQLQAVLRDQAKTVGVYYEQLIECGIPAPLACQVVRDWHGYFCHSSWRDEED